MSTPKYCFAVVLAALVMAASACTLLNPGPIGPALTLVSDAPEPNGLCRKSRGKLLVSVKNEGGAPSSALARIEVSFLPSGGASLPTGSIPAGVTIDREFEIPGGCFQPQCDFRVVVAQGAIGSPGRRVYAEGVGSCPG